MKVLHVSLSDRVGGAAIGAYRFHQSLLRAGLRSEMLVLRKITADPTVHRLSDSFKRWQRARRRLAERRHQRHMQANPRTAQSGHWSLNLFEYPIAAAINQFAADVVHLHWVGDNFLPLGQLEQIKAPIVWTLRDMWAFTGGCHTALDCGNYRSGCGNCPQLQTAAATDMSARINARKQRAWAAIPLTIVCLSRWLADCARQSAILKEKRIEVIGNPVDPAVFKPLDKAAARRAFNLPSDKKLILFGAVGGTRDRLKGFGYLQEALRAFSYDAVELVLFGAESVADPQLNLPWHSVGRLQDEVSLSLLYSACDVYVLPTLQDTFPKTVLESLACGSPCVIFDGSGTVDLVQQRQNGYVARLKDSADLRQGLEWVLQQDWSRLELHQQIVARYGQRRIADKTIRLYELLLGESK